MIGYNERCGLVDRVSQGYRDKVTSIVDKSFINSSWLLSIRESSTTASGGALRGDKGREHG